MAKTFIGVREVDEETFRKFRARAVAENMKLGEALTIAMKNLIKEKKEGKRTLANLHHLKRIKPFNFGKGNKNLSEKIDEILYG